MDVFKLDMDHSECLEEEFSLKRKFSKTPTLSTISEESSRSSLSGGSQFSSKGLDPIHLTPKSKRMRAMRKLFSAEDNGMELGQSSSDCLEGTPPSKGQTPANIALWEQSASDRNSVQESSSKIDWTPKKALKDQNRQNRAYKHALKTEGSNADGGEVREEIHNTFDKLFVCGIFNAVKPASPTVKELQTMYINNSSEDDGSPSPKKCRKMSQMPKKKAQSKLTFKRVKNAANPLLDSENDSDF